MPYATVRGIQINYEIFGESGAWIALSPGARNSYNDFVPIARRLAVAGYRVLLHDRRNCGASDVAIEGTESESVQWADDLHTLLNHLGALPAFIGGSSAGCRMAIIFALRHPEATRALLLWRITGGAFAATDLAEAYYGQYIRIAEQGGMQAVCDSDHFRMRVAARPENRDRLLGIEPMTFINIMSRWRDDFLHGANQPIIGASESDLRSISCEACLVPGNDRIHNPTAAARLQALLPNAELRNLVGQRAEGDLLPEWSKAEWDAKEDDLSRLFVDFLRRIEGSPQ
jgi:pimeloyl-ACP methyl ester carboxylesterase